MKMKNIKIIIFGILVNAVIYLYSQYTKMDLNMIIPQLFLFFIIPLILFIILMVLIFNNYLKGRNKNGIFSMVLIAFFLLLIVVQFLLFSDRVLVR